MERLETYMNYDKFSANHYGDDIQLMEKFSHRYGVQFTIYRHHGSCEIQGKTVSLNNVVIVSGPTNALMAFRLQWGQPFLQKPYYGHATKLGSVKDGKFAIHISTKLRF